jgi:hypothetical protein
MTFVSLAVAARRLGIDVKTLHRWLADAQLPLQCCPHDGRKKGVSGEHLVELARLHQRRLACSEEEGAAQLSCQLPTVSAELLLLPAQLAALHAQLVTLQQQVSNLSRLLQQHTPEPAIPVARRKPTRTAKHPSKSTLPAARSHRAVKAPSKPVHVIPRVEYSQEGRYVVISPKQGLLPIRPDSQEWFAWVAQQTSFRFVGQAGYFTAHHEWRVPKGAWRAHRKIRNRTCIQRLAPNQELTMAVLEQAALALQTLLS